MTIQRRRFIEMAAIGAAGLVWPATVPLASASAISALAAPRLLEILGAGHVVRLGVRYRERVPAENDVDVLAQAILSAPPSAASATVAARLDEQVRGDFTDGRTVVVDGWILSVTEARQCALYSLQLT